MSSTWKNRLSLTIFGQSHGAAIGVTLEGLPAGESVDMDSLYAFLQRRAPGRFLWSTQRKEEDRPEFLSGIVNGKTCGAPITAIIRNENTRPGDYTKNIPRPGHADYTAYIKHNGYADLSGGGHFSGRLTAGLCIAGGICLQVLKRRGIVIGAHIASVGKAADSLFDQENITESTIAGLWEMDIPTLDPKAASIIIEEIDQARQNKDSVGGTIECAAMGIPPGLGDPMFFGMENRIAGLVFAIPAVKGIEFGAGFSSAAKCGSENNDPFYVDDGVVKTRGNNHGGILGGITTGMPLTFKAAIKPTPSIGIEQESVDLTKMEHTPLTISGRHDPCIVPRAVPCMESVMAIAVSDAIF